MKSKCPICNRSIGNDGAANPDKQDRNPELELKPVSYEIQAECENVIYSLAEVATLTGRSPGTTVILELLKAIPHLPQKIHEGDKNSLLARYLLDANTKNPGHRLNAAIDGLGRFAGLGAVDRMIVEAAISGTFTGWVAGGSRQ